MIRATFVEEGRVGELVWDAGQLDGDPEAVEWCRKIAALRVELATPAPGPVVVSGLDEHWSARATIVAALGHCQAATLDDDEDPDPGPGVVY